MPVSNPATFNTDDTFAGYKSFTYEGGKELYNFSPHDSGLSKSMEMNIMFFADSEEHAADVLRRLFMFWLGCLKEEAERNHSTHKHYYLGRKKYEYTQISKILLNAPKWKFNKVPVNQVFKVAWAHNDTL